MYFHFFSILILYLRIVSCIVMFHFICIQIEYRYSFIFQLSVRRLSFFSVATSILVCIICCSWWSCFDCILVFFGFDPRCATPIGLRSILRTEIDVRFYWCPMYWWFAWRWSPSAAHCFPRFVCNWHRDWPVNPRRPTPLAHVAWPILVQQQQQQQQWNEMNQSLLLFSFSPHNNTTNSFQHRVTFQSIGGTTIHGGGWQYHFERCGR